MRGDTGARGLVTELDALASIVPVTYPCNLLGVRNPDGPLETIWAAGQPLDVGEGFERIAAYRGRLYISRGNQAGAVYPSAVVAGFAARGAEADTYLREQLAAIEAARKVLDQQILQHGPLLMRAKVYLAGVEG